MNLFIYNKLDEYLAGKGKELSENEIKELAIYRNKDLFVYTRTQEVSIKDRISNLGNIPINEVLIHMIREIRSISDVVIIDVGADINTSLLLELMNLGNVEKLLITTQNIETLNTIGYKLRFSHGRYYNDWGLIVNKYDKKIPIKENEIASFFYDTNIDYLKYVLNGIHYIPYSEELISCKSQRDVAYKKDKEYAKGIDELINKIYPIDVKKKKKLFGMI